MKLADYVINFLAEQGVSHLFLLAGGGVMHLLDALNRCRGVQAVPLLHEQSCAIAAATWARVTGRPGAALVTTGPGGTNAITGVAGAWYESSPLLVISGQVKRSDLKRDSGVRQLGIQENDIISMVRPITKYAVTVEDPSAIRYHLELAFKLATSGRQGPVWLDLPLDVQGQVMAAQKPAGCPEALIGEQVATPAGEAEQVLELLNRARRPVLLAGQGIIRAGACDRFREVVELLGIPVLTTWMAAELLPGEHPLFMGRPGLIASRGANFILQNSDLLLAIGARLDFTVTGYDLRGFAPAAVKVAVDIDRSELLKLGEVLNLAVVADAGDFLWELLARRHLIRPCERQRWLDYCDRVRRRYPLLRPECFRPDRYVDIYAFTRVLSEEMDEEELIIPGSSGAFLDAFCVGYLPKSRQRFICTGGLGAMGFALPGSIGGCLAAGGRRVVAVDGDGGFQLNLQELAVVRGRNLPVKCFVINNQGYAAIRLMQERHFQGRRVGCDRSSGVFFPELAGVARAYDIPFLRIEDNAGLRWGIREALAADGPILCEIVVDPGQPVLPRVVSEVCPDGSLRSRPLEDLWPWLEREELEENMAISREGGGQPQS